MAQPQGRYTAADFDYSPLMFYYETTLACDLVCKHCRAEAQPAAHPEELTTAQAVALVEQVATFPRPPSMVFTGGDPLKRPDLFELLAHARSVGLEPVLTPSATPLATREAFARAKAAGVQRIGLSLDGADPATHDAFRGWSGSFQRTMQMLADARDLGLSVQVNTSLCRRNFHQLDQIAELLASQQIVMWAVFFLVPVGRAVGEERLQPEEYEQAFARLWYHAQNQPYAVKTTEAPHYRRFVLQQGGDPLAGPRWEALQRVRQSATGPGSLGKESVALRDNIPSRTAEEDTPAEAGNQRSTHPAAPFARPPTYPEGRGDYGEAPAQPPVA
ncbi:MAG: radical SAM protein [Thermoguttaceae bacterium]|nr:radical SAM protein [Thermoguttaceae bacterium]MDW8038234.1 radical SAM protein [Thermoguttaceae bacterium]